MSSPKSESPGRTITMAEITRVRLATSFASMMAAEGANPQPRGERLLLNCVLCGTDKAATMSVVRDDRPELFHCWSCKWTGDVYRFVQVIHGMSFAEAFELLRSKTLLS